MREGVIRRTAVFSSRRPFISAFGFDREGLPDPRISHSRTLLPPQVVARQADHTIQKSVLYSGNNAGVFQTVGQILKGVWGINPPSDSRKESSF
jgi:hypothetical protein